MRNRTPFNSLEVICDRCGRSIEIVSLADASWFCVFKSLVREGWQSGGLYPGDPDLCPHCRDEERGIGWKH